MRKLLKQIPAVMAGLMICGCGEDPEPLVKPIETNASPATIAQASEGTDPGSAAEVPRDGFKVFYPGQHQFAHSGVLLSYTNGFVTVEVWDNKGGPVIALWNRATDYKPVNDLQQKTMSLYQVGVGQTNRIAVTNRGGFLYGRLDRSTAPWKLMIRTHGHSYIPDWSAKFTFQTIWMREL
ncbi:MAG: hypothetical protein CMO80_18110 [Verrucomicrobiales bacterium]|mgnify:CR=1 FL=1|nr:hypothetical protein [Verrucomicrobiales bacterium]|tara:strand:+ start:1888 stop:2427 length:540 start_codon:yes stop_codon:yes gene_type:complete